MDNQQPTSKEPVIPGLVAEGQANAYRPAPKYEPENPGDDLSMKDLVDQFSQFFLVLRAKWYWGVLAAVLVGVGMGYVLLRKPVESKARVSLLAQSNLDSLLGIASPDLNDSQRREENMRAHLERMKSRRFHVAFAETLTEADKKELVAPYLEPGMKMSDTMVLNLIGGRTDVQREKGRDFFMVEFQHLNPDVAVKFVDKFAAKYISFVQEEQKRTNIEGFNVLQRQIELTRAELAKDEEERLEFRKENAIISRDDNHGITADRLRRLDGAMTEARIRRLAIENQLNRVEADLKNAELPWDNSYLASYADNNSLRQQWVSLTNQKEVLSRRYGENHPRMKELTISLENLDKNIRRNFKFAVEDLQGQLRGAVGAEEQLQKEFNEAFNRSIETEKLVSRYELIGGDTATLRETLVELRRKISRANLASQVTADVMQVVDAGFVVRERISKRMVQMAGIGLAAAVAFLFAPFLANLFDERIKATVDIEALLGKPLLSAIPNLQVRDEDRPHLVRDRIDATITETFVAIVGGLDLNNSAKYPKCIMVTSTLPGEGKSTISSNLASTYAQLGKRVVMLDLDLRRPTQHRQHGLNLSPGFLSWANGGYKLDDLDNLQGAFYRHVLADGVHLVTAGGSNPQPSNFFVSKQMGELVSRLMEMYDVVLLDTAPAGLFQDSLVLSRNAQMRILVSRVGKAPVAQVKKVVESFERAKAGFTGVVMNGFDPSLAHKKLAYGYSAEGYSYKAHEEGDSAKGEAKS